jgi:hypothetical protein
MQDSDVNFILRVCELYGRFALHKQASGQRCVAFSEQAKRLLQWTTFKVLPALTERSQLETEMTPFDPNLSSIAIEQSFENQPSSPIPTGPPKRRANRNRTPRKETDDFEILENGPPYNAVGRAFAVSLMQTSCVIFSEWLAVGGVGAKEIDAAAASWCEIFTTDVTEQNTESEMQEALLVAFSRLAIQLCKVSEQCSLLKALLVCCKETQDAESMDAIRRALSSVLSGSPASAGTDCLVKCTLEAAYVHIDRESSAYVYALPTSLGQLWPSGQGLVAIALNAVLASKPASLALAKRLIDSVASIADEGSSRALFRAKCLWILCDSASCKGSTEIVAMVRRIDTRMVDRDSVIRGIYDDLKDGVA